MNMNSISNTLEAPVSETSASLYVDLLKRVLTRAAFPELFNAVNLAGDKGERMANWLLRLARRATKNPELQFAVKVSHDRAARAVGKDWPTEAETMVGMARLNNLQACIEDVLANNVPGDLIETGVWRGGSTILMRGILKAHQVRDRNVWVADSFQGLPKPNAEKYPADLNDTHWTYPELAVGVEQVRANFRRYDLLDDQVKFLVGWFRDTLPTAPIEELAVIRLDGDLYESTMDGLTNLYPKLSIGGYIIIDDFGAVPACKKAVLDFRAAQQIVDPIQEIDWTGIYWQRSDRRR